MNTTTTITNLVSTNTGAIPNVASMRGVSILKTSSFALQTTRDFGLGPEVWDCTSVHARPNLLRPHSADLEPSCLLLSKAVDISADGNRSRHQSRFAYPFKATDMKRTISIDLDHVWVIKGMAAQVQLHASDFTSLTERPECHFEIEFKYERSKVWKVKQIDRSHHWSSFKEQRVLADTSSTTQYVKVESSFADHPVVPGHIGSKVITAQNVQFAFPVYKDCNISVSPIRLFVYGHERPGEERPFFKVIDHGAAADLALAVVACAILLVLLAAIVAVSLVFAQRAKKLWGTRQRFSPLNKETATKGEVSREEEFGHVDDNHIATSPLVEDHVPNDVAVVSMHSIRDEIQRRESRSSFSTPGSEALGDSTESSSDEEKSPFTQEESKI